MLVTGYYQREDNLSPDINERNRKKNKAKELAADGKGVTLARTKQLNGDELLRGWPK
jgi:hypothetical protein